MGGSFAWMVHSPWQPPLRPVRTGIASHIDAVGCWQRLARAVNCGLCCLRGL